MRGTRGEGGKGGAAGEQLRLSGLGLHHQDGAGPGHGVFPRFIGLRIRIHGWFTNQNRVAYMSFPKGSVGYDFI